MPRAGLSRDRWIAKALQASECSELLDLTRANCWISAQHQPGEDQRISLVLRFAGANMPKRNGFRNHRHMNWQRIVPWRTVFDEWLTRGSLGVLILAMCQARATRKSA